MCNYGAGVAIKLDQGFKNTGRIRVGRERVMESTLTVQNERLQIVGQYHGSAGLKSFFVPLSRMSARFRALKVSACTAVATGHLLQQSTQKANHWHAIHLQNHLALSPTMHHDIQTIYVYPSTSALGMAIL